MCAVLSPFGGAVHAQDQAGLIEASAALEPGDFVWDELAGVTADEISISVSIALQRAYIWRGNELIAATTVSTGKPGHETPLGNYPILQKARHHRSNLYSNSPMPFMQRLTWDGIALHAGDNPGYPDSHGCIRLPFEFARNLFALTRLGVPVTILDYPDLPVRLEFADLDAGERQLANAPLSHEPLTRRPRLEYAWAVLLADWPQR